MADRKDVVEFIREVEKHPCIYNVTMPEYSNRRETKRAWCKIAETMDSTEQECKEKWRRLRIAFMRSLKHAKATNETKPYYLYDYLTFLLPFVKISDQQIHEHDGTVTSLSPAYSDDEEPRKNKIEFESEDDRNDMNGHIVYLDDRLANRQRQIGRKRKKSVDVESNPRKMFLLSLLPDVESFTEEEMRTFRRTVVNCIDNIIDSRKRV